MPEKHAAAFLPENTSGIFVDMALQPNTQHSHMLQVERQYLGVRLRRLQHIHFIARPLPYPGTARTVDHLSLQNALLLTCENEGTSSFHI